MKPIGKAWKKKIRRNREAMRLIILSIALILFSCSNTGNCLQEEVRICELSSGSPQKLTLSEVFNFDWDELYVVTGPRLPDDVSQMIGRDYKSTIPDDTRQYIFVNHDKIVRDEQSNCRCLDYFSETANDGFIRYTPASSILVRCKSVEGEVICTVEHH